MRTALEVADIFRRHGAAYRSAHDAHMGRVERRIMGAIEVCRTASLGGHVEACEDCRHSRIAYNSCRNRHCPKCQGLARAEWLADRQADLLPAPYFHVVFTVPAEVAAMAFQNKAVIYAILFQAAAETLRTIAADPRHLGAEKGASFGRFGGWRRRYPGGSECRSIFLTVPRAMPNRLAASRWLRPSTWQASRTRRYRSTVYILPPSISKKIEGYRWQSFTPPAAGKSRRFRGLICHRRSHSPDPGPRHLHRHPSPKPRYPSLAHDAGRFPSRTLLGQIDQARPSGAAPPIAASSRAFTCALTRISRTVASACAAMILAFASLLALQGARRGPATAPSPQATISNSLLSTEVISAVRP